MQSVGVEVAEGRGKGGRFGLRRLHLISDEIRVGADVPFITAISGQWRLADLLWSDQGSRCEDVYCLALGIYTRFGIDLLSLRRRGGELRF